MRCNTDGKFTVSSQTARSLRGIRLLTGLLLTLLILLGNLTLAFYLIDRKRYEHIQAQIREMETSKD